MPEFTLGVLDNIFIAIILAVLSFGLASGIYRHYKLDVKFFELPFFAGHWVAFGLMWLMFGMAMFLGWVGSLDAGKIFSLIGNVFFVIQAVLLIIFLYRRFINIKYGGVIISSGVSVLGLIVLILIFVSKINYAGLQTWDARWLVPMEILVLYGIILFLPIVIGCLIMLFRQLYLKSSEKAKEDYDLLFLFVPLPILLYAGLLLVDMMSILGGIWVIILRLAILFGIFLVFIVISNKKLNKYGIEHGFKVRSPLVVKSIVYSIFTAVIPLFIAGLLLAYSFDVILETVGISSLLAISTELKLQILVTVVIIGILSFLVSLIAIKTIENRIKAIIQGMYEVLNSNFKFRVSHSELKDEVSSLAIAFNGMAQDLSNYEQEINKYSQILEDKVEARTKELEQKTKEAEKLYEENKLYYDQLQKRTSIITDQMADGLIVVDGSKKLLRGNASFYRMFRIKKNEIVGKKLNQISELAPYEDFDFVIDKFLREGLDTYQYKIQLKPPLSGMLQCQLTPYKVGEKESGAIILLRDITPPWGIVYNAINMQPLPEVVVRLYNEANDKIIASETSDEAGRYTFYVTPGKYYLKAFKKGFHFPAKNPLGYHGEVLNIKNKEQGIIHFDILMDYIGRDVEKMGLTNEQMVQVEDALESDNAQAHKENKQVDEDDDDGTFVKMMEQYKDE